MFQHFYDGRRKFGPKNILAQYDVEEIGRGDVVLAECFISRYRCDEGGKPVYEGGWKRYRAGFELKFLTILQEGVEVTDIQPQIDDSGTKRM